MRTKIVYVHGIKLNRDDTFPNKMIKEFGNEYEHIKSNWGEVVGLFFDKYFDENYEKPTKRHFILMKTYKLRRMFWEFVGDVLIYFTKRDLIIDKLHDQVKGDEKVVIIAHSMGSVIVDEMLRKHSPLNVVKVITMGNPLAMFRIGETGRHSIIYDWANYYEQNDWIATKIQKLPGYVFVRDIEVKSKHVWKGWNFLSHITYWKSNDLIDKIKESITHLK